MEVTAGLDEAIRRDGLRAIGWTEGARDPALTDLARLAAHIADTPMAAVTLLIGDRQWFVAAHGLDAVSIPRDDALCARLLDAEDMFVVEDTQLDPMLKDHGLVTGQPHVRFYGGVPLCQQRSMIGTLCVMGREPRALAGTQREHVLLVAAQVAASLELRRRDTELAIARAQLADVVDVARLVTWHRVLPGGHTQWFGPIRDVLGVHEPDGRPGMLRKRIHPDDAPKILADFDKQLAEGGAIARQCRIVTDDGRTRWVHIHSRVELRDGRAAVSAGTVLDITEARQQEISLAHVLSRVDDAIVGFDRDLRIRYLNPSAVEQTGKTEDQLIGKTLPEIWPLDDSDRVVAAFATALREKRAINLEERFAPLDRYFALRMFPSGDGVTVFATDVTAQRTAAVAQAELLARVRALAARVQEVREEESRRIARELHDQLGQELTVLKLDVARLARTATGEAAARIADMLVQLDGIADVVRQIAMRLRPQLLDDLGLAAAVEWQARELGRRTGIAVGVQAEPVELGQAPAIALFRVLQEALTNVVRHAAATEVSILLARTGGRIVLAVDDDGVGIREPVPFESLGLLGMRERMIAVGGELVIERRSPHGTRVVARLPGG